MHVYIRICTCVYVYIYTYVCVYIYIYKENMYISSTTPPVPNCFATIQRCVCTALCRSFFPSTCTIGNPINTLQQSSR